jgi:hypothetical protein
MPTGAAVMEAETTVKIPEFDGGHAFPKDATMGGGMTLRDYFAAQAMQVAYHWHFSEAHNPSDCWLPSLTEVAESAYKMADAMLAARKS